MITVVIPTYNQVECIRKIIDTCVIPYRGNLFIFQVQDSSETDIIQQIIERAIEIYTLTNLIYVRWPSGISGDDKALQSIEQVDTEYFWLFGDGNLADFNALEDFLIHHHYEIYDILNIEVIERIGHRGQDLDARVNYIYSYDDIVFYMKKYFSHLTYWGSSIVSRDFFALAVDTNIIKKKYMEQNIPWWYACLLCEAGDKAVSYQRSVHLGTFFSPYIAYNPMKLDHSWTHDERYYEFVFKKFSMAIDLLPSRYSGITYHITEYFRKDALVSYSYLLFLRSIGIINRNMIAKYDVYIKRVPKYRYILLFYSYLPQTVAKYMEWLKNTVKNILKK